jgi:cell division protein ZapB
MYEKGSEFAIGQHKVEVYTDDYLMGKGSFIVK